MNSIATFRIHFQKFPCQAKNQPLHFSDGEMEFHVSRKARDKYKFDSSLFSTNGTVIFANFHGAQTFAQKINAKRDLLHFPEEAVSAAEINAMGLIDEILHSIMSHYRQNINPQVFQNALDWLEDKFTTDELNRALNLFVEEFPPLDVYLNKTTAAKYLQGETNGRTNREIALEEMLMLRLANMNPAFTRYSELFDDSELQEKTRYGDMMSNIKDFFATQLPMSPGFGAENLFDLLRMPALSNPESLIDQLHFLRNRWGATLTSTLNIKWGLILGEGFQDKWGVPDTEYETRLLRGVDYISEETKMRFNPGLGPAPTHVPDYNWQDDEPEQFSPDMHWMPRLVLMAKSTLVWLDQLSKKYEREIKTLGDIPDEEIDQLASWGFTGLWLIGIWERSSASQRIKHICGNPDAAASAYALYDYRIAESLGGEAAYEILRERCSERGVRLASDMVPNHTGVYSRLMREKPDWFVQLSYPPFPSYAFDGPDLSEDPNVGIFLEKHYYDQTDASVVFKRIDNNTGVSRYIYHGNDGTSMPWNDTAQLDYTKPEVREAIIQTILDVARKFPIIRFDAAMTLAKRHYQRLWFPEPGSGGDIPSRAEHGLTKQQFNSLMPIEFWRELVDRVAEEAPDTLLLAEAFWMMEGYFVRTLGMHRVYNSAFMNMLKNEENKKYRYTIKNTIEFEPEILKRYVNFMNNPDEETAIRQFGDGDKYFGICMMMATMPGLPMFGHGQVEGFEEKYGMEYHRAYMDESPKDYLVERHQREIFPVLKKRYLFAGVSDFLLYDFYSVNGRVNENVFAFSNRYQDEKTLVVFHNAHNNVRGWIRTSAAYSEKTGGPDEKRLVQKTLGEGLSLSQEDAVFSIFRDSVSGLEYIRKSATLWQKGMYIELGAYKYQVYLNFREVQDDDSGQYARLHDSLKGQGVPSIDEALQEIHLQPLHQALREVLDAKRIAACWEAPSEVEPKTETAKSKVKSAKAETTAELSPLLQTEKCYRSFLEVARQYAGFETSADVVARETFRELAAIIDLDAAKLKKRYAVAKSRKSTAALKFLGNIISDGPESREILTLWTMFHRIGDLDTPESSASRSRGLLDEWLLHKIMRRYLRKTNVAPEKIEPVISTVKLLIAHQDWYQPEGPKTTLPYRLLEDLLNDTEAQRTMDINRFNGTIWFNKEAFRSATAWLFAIAILKPTLVKSKKSTGKKGKSVKKQAGKKEAIAQMIIDVHAIIEKWYKAEVNSEYKVEQLLAALKPKKKKRAVAEKKVAKKAAGKIKTTAKKKSTTRKKVAAKKKSSKK